MRIHDKNLLVLILLAMNEGDKETARFRTNYVLKKPAGQVVIDLMLQYVLAVLQWAGIASGWRGGGTGMGRGS